MASSKKTEKNATVKTAGPKKGTRTAKVAKKAPTPRKSSKKASSPVVAAVRTYPFDSKRDITARIVADDQEAVAALTKIHSLDAGMCSQKKLISGLAARVVEAGDKASTDSKLVDECRVLSLRYVRRLAKEARRERLAANPELKELASLFSASA